MSDKDVFYDIFFIYHPADKDQARRIAAQLRATDISVHFAEDEFGKTAESLKRMKDGALRSYTAAFVMSPNSAESQLCNELLQYAVSSGKRLVTLILDDNIDVEVHPAIAQNPYVFFRKSDDLAARVDELRAYLRADPHLKLHTELLALAEKWRERGRPPELLLPPDRLDEARGWLAAASARHPKPSQLQLEFIHGSRRQPPRPGRASSRHLTLGILAVIALGGCLLLLQSAVAGWRANQIADERTNEARTQTALAAAEATAAGDSTVGLIDSVAATSASLRLAVAQRATAEAIAATAAFQLTRTAEADERIRAAQLRATEVAKLERGEVARRLVQAGEEALDAGDSELALALAWVAKDWLDKPKAAYRLLRRAAAIERAMTIDEVALLRIQPAGAGFAIVPGSRDALRIYAGDTWSRRSDLTDHEGEIAAIAYSSAGDRLISATEAGEIVIRDGFTGEAERRLNGHRGAVTALALSPDGERLYSGASQPQLIAWNLDSGEQVAAYARDDEWRIADLALSADGGRLIGFYELGGRSVMAQWSAETLELLTGDSGGRVYRGYDGHGRLAYSGGSSLPAFPGDSNTGDLTLWDLATGERRAQLTDGFNWSFLSGDSLAAATDDLLFIAFHEDIALVTVENNASGRSANLVNIAEGRLLRRFSDEQAKLLTSAEFIDRETILSATRDNRVLLWSSLDGRLIREIGAAPGKIAQVQASAAANLAIALTADGAAHIWALSDAGAQPLLALRDVPPGAVISPSGRQIFALDSAGLSLRDADAGELLVQLRASLVSRVDGAFAVFDGERIAVHDIETGAAIRQWEWREDAIAELHLAPDGETLLAVGDSGELWLARGEADRLERLAGEDLRPSLVRFAPGGEWLLTLHEEIALIWELETGEARGYPLGFASRGAVQAAFSADGESLIFFVQLEDGLAGLTRIGLADNEARRQVFVDVSAAALSADGEWLSLVNGDGRVQVVASESGAIMRQFRAEVGDMQKLSYQPETDRLITAAGSELLIWDAEAGAVDQRFAHADALIEFSLSQDGRRILTTDASGFYRLWQVESATELMARVAAEHSPRPLSCGEREQYLVAPLCE